MSYRVIFDDNCPDWSPDPEQNLDYLKSMEQCFNNKFESDGYLYLKDALNALGLACPFNEGIGWWYEVGELPWNTENYISLGLYNPKLVVNRRFVNGLVPNCILDFNCHGNLNDYMLDQAIYIGGPELAQDFFDYPFIHFDLTEGGIRWDEKRW